MSETKKAKAAKRKTKAAKAARLTAAQKRVLVARDVLDHLRRGRIVAGGCYFQVADPTALDAPEPEAKVRDVLAKIQRCEVCGIGAAFYALVRRYDGLAVGDLPDPFGMLGDDIDVADLRDKLAELFADDQVAMIEAAYEGSNATVDYHYADGPGVRRAAEMFGYFEPRPERMRRIFQNVIDHKGRFVPPRPPGPPDRR